MDVVKWFQLKYYQYNLSTALYMLEPWERLAFSTSWFPFDPKN